MDSIAIEFSSALKLEIDHFLGIAPATYQDCTGSCFSFNKEMVILTGRKMKFSMASLHHSTNGESLNFPLFKVISEYLARLGSCQVNRFCPPSAKDSISISTS